MDSGISGGGAYRETRARRWPQAESEGVPEPLDRSWLLPFLLLCLQERNLHGYELVYEVGNLGVGGVRAKDIYRLLQEAETEGSSSPRGERPSACSRGATTG